MHLFDIARHLQAPTALNSHPFSFSQHILLYIYVHVYTYVYVSDNVMRCKLSDSSRDFLNQQCRI